MMSDPMVKMRGMVFMMMTMMIMLSYHYWRPAGNSTIHFVCLFVLSLCLFVCLFVCFGATASSFTRFLDHTQQRTTGDRTPLDE